MMCELATKTPAELNAMNKADIIAKILEDVTRSTTDLEQDEHGNAIRQEETITDAYGTLLGTKQTVWTYYGSGEVNVITVQEFDAKHKFLSGYTVKHYKDEKQPTLTIIYGPR